MQVCVQVCVRALSACVTVCISIATESLDQPAGTSGCVLGRRGDAAPLLIGSWGWEVW